MYSYRMDSAESLNDIEEPEALNAIEDPEALNDTRGAIKYTISVFKK